MKWMWLLFLVACGPAFTTASDDAEPTEALRLAPEATPNEEASPEASRAEPRAGDDAQLPDSGTGAQDAGTIPDAFVCNLSCEPRCVAEVDPLHACCDAVGGCHCSLSAGYCAI